jgi:amidase
MDEVIWRDALGQAEAIRSGEVSAAELLAAYLERIDALDGVLRAYVTVDREGAQAEATKIDAHRRAEPASLPAFAGIPISIKDTDDVAGMPTTHSCSVLAGRTATEDAPIVSRFRQAGTIILGKSNLPEFCSSITNSRLNGSCRNPWDLSRTAGGSSGGAGAALAGGLCAMSHGTDGGGSVRTPASWCGVVGIKPTRGLVTFGPELDHPSYGTSSHGILTRSIRDMAAMLDVIAPQGSWTPSRPHSFADEILRPPEQLRIGLCTSYPAGEVQPEVAAAIEHAGQLAEDLGHLVEWAHPTWETMLSAMVPMAAPGVANLVDISDIDRLEPRNQAMLRYELELTVLDHYRMIERTRAARLEFLKLWSDLDVLITPVAGIVAPPVEWAWWDQTPEEHRRRFAEYANFAHPINLSGQPALSLPLAWTEAGLPIGVQLVGRPLEEALILRLSAQFEQASPWLEQMRSIPPILAE